MTIVHNFTVTSLCVSRMVDEGIYCARDLTLDWNETPNYNLRDTFRSAGEVKRFAVDRKVTRGLPNSWESQDGVESNL